jgi:ABC-2 type transport system ATP-binding protein
MIRFRSALTEEGMGKLLNDLIRAGVPITQFREVQTDLEEAFMTFANAKPESNGRSAKGPTHG